jgi:DNA-binding response OmpR family regulator
MGADGPVRTQDVIVVADDDILRLVSFAVERRGYRAITAEDGDAALRAIIDGAPVLAILDVRMPLLTGVEVLSRMKQDRALQAIPVILLSATGTKAEIEAGLALGAADYVVKPFVMRDLMATVLRLAGKGGPQSP